jgi:hypothetical protein
MTNTAPNETTLLNLSADVANDAALKALAGTPEGKRLRAAPEHILLQAARNLNQVVVIIDDVSYVKWPSAMWLVLRVCDISALSGLKANWLLTPAFISQVLADLVNAGGLKLTLAKHEAEIAVAMVKASKVMPVIRAKPEDVIELDPPNSGAWLDSACTSSFMDEDGKGRTYAQMHASLGGWCCPADVLASRAVVAQIPYTFEKIAGDMQGLAPADQEAVIGAAYLQTTLPDRLDFIPPSTGLMVEIFRRAGPDPFTPLFTARWTTAYKSFAALCHASSTAKCASNGEAKSVALAAAIILGYGDSWNPQLMDAVESTLSIAVDLVDVDEYADSTPLQRVSEAASLALRIKTKTTGTNDTKSNATESDGPNLTTDSDERWAEAARDPDFKALIAALTPLNTVPFPSEKVAIVLLESPSAVGALYMNGAKVPEKMTLSKMSGARSKGTIQKVFNAAVMIDRKGTAHPEWATPISEDTCYNMVQGKWIKFTTFREGSVVCDATSMDWWRDIVRPVIEKEDGVASATELSPATNEPLSVFLDSRRLARAMPILDAWFKRLGIKGSHGHSFKGLAHNISTRLANIEAMPPCKGKRSLMQALRFTTASGILEGQRKYASMLEMSVTHARRDDNFVEPTGTTHSNFALVDSIIEVQRKRAQEEAFDPDGGDGGREQKHHRGRSQDEQSSRTWNSTVFGSAVSSGLLQPTPTGGFNYGNQINIEPAGPKPIKRLCAGALASAFGWSSEQASKWCNNIGQCTAVARSGGDPHVSLPTGITTADIVITRLGNQPSSSRGGGKGSRGGSSPRGGKGRRGGKSGGRSNSGKGTKGDGAVLKRGGKGQRAPGGKGNFGRQHSA